MTKRTFCPYCGTANLVNKQLCFVENGLVVFKCHFCKKIFTDMSIDKDDLQTTKNE